MRHLLPRARVVVITLNMKISRLCVANYVKKLRQGERAATEVSFPYSANYIIDLRRCRHRFLNFLV